jgi:hypothetical protein
MADPLERIKAIGFTLAGRWVAAESKLAFEPPECPQDQLKTPGHCPMNLLGIIREWFAVRLMIP